MEIPAPLIAASTQRQIGYVIAAIVLAAMVVYWIFNWLEGRKESGSELELAPNRQPGMSDEEMETTRLDLSLTSGLIMLTIISVALPVYWLGEPGRQSGLVEFIDDQAIRQGEEIYTTTCSSCHGSVNGDGGVVADYSLVDNNGVYVQQVQWKAPSLAAVLDRFSYDEVKYILNFGRPNSPMPAWGTPGGGPMTVQQIDKLIAYIASEQKTSEEIAKGVSDGLDDAALAKAQAENPDASSDELQDLADEILAAAQGDDVILGELLFTNPAASGAYGCARCHSAGWSYDANDFPDNPLIEPVLNGGGGFGPSLIGISDQFETAQEQNNFVSIGSRNGVGYGAFGQGDGGGQMPAFGQCSADKNDELGRVESNRIADHCDGRAGVLTEAQIAAIVAYERSLD